MDRKPAQDLDRWLTTDLSQNEKDREEFNRTAYLAAKKELKAIGIVLFYNAEYEEYRVNFSGNANREATAYYTNSLEDAIGTAKGMIKEREKAGK